MGIYESEYKCGCKSMSTTYDKNDPEIITKVCDKHKLEVNKEFNYNLEGFKKRHKSNLITRTYFKVKILDIKINAKGYNLVKMEVNDFDITKLDNSTKIYFSEFGEEDKYVSTRRYGQKESTMVDSGSSFENINGRSIIIDIFKTEYIDRSQKIDG